MLSNQRDFYDPHITQSSWLLMLHCRVAMLVVIEAMSPAAAGAVPVTPWQEKFYNTFFFS